IAVRSRSAMAGYIRSQMISGLGVYDTRESPSACNSVERDFPMRTKLARTSEGQVPDKGSDEPMIRNRADGTAQIAAVKAIVMARGNFLVEASPDDGAEGVLVI